MLHVKAGQGPHQERLVSRHIQANDLHIAVWRLPLLLLLLLLLGGGCPLGQVGIVGQPGAREAVGGQVVQQIQ